MKILRLLALMMLVLMMLGASCRGVHLPPIAVEPNDTENCPAACENLRLLGCPEGLPVENGDTCEKVCVDQQQQGLPRNPTCVMKMSACSELEGCTNPTR